MKHLEIYESLAEVQADINNNILVKPYIALYDNRHKVEFDDVVYNNIDYTSTPLTFEILSSGIIKWKSDSSTYTCTIQYKKNDEDWTNITSTTSGVSFSVSTGDIIQFRGNNNTYSLSNINKYVSFNGTTCRFNVYGNIMSLINGFDFKNLRILPQGYSFTFCYLFGFCSGLVEANRLILPATTLTTGCYESMFYKCTSLISIPDLPALILPIEAYSQMFMYCSSLESAPVLPATGMAQYCYNNMFGYCTNLTEVPEDMLPATTLAQSCYANMFVYSGIQRGPDLIAKTLVPYCYENLFGGCSKIHYIKCLATSISASNCTRGWTFNIPSYGTFVKDSNTSWSTGNNGIPSNWTIENA